MLAKGVWHLGIAIVISASLVGGVLISVSGSTDWDRLTRVLIGCIFFMVMGAAFMVASHGPPKN